MIIKECIMERNITLVSCQLVLKVKLSKWTCQLVEQRHAKLLNKTTFLFILFIKYFNQNRALKSDDNFNKSFLKIPTSYVTGLFVEKQVGNNLKQKPLMILEDNFGAMPPHKRAKHGMSDADDDSEDYRRKRDRNNEAVKKSRFKSKQKTQETFSRVSKLKSENQMLEEKVNSLTKELQFLKDLFLAHASNSQSAKHQGIDLQKLLEDVPDDDKKDTSSASKK